MCLVTQGKFYWPHIANDVYTKVSNYSARARNQIELKYQRQLRLFPAGSPLAITPFNFVGPLSGTADWNQYVFVMPDSYLILTRALLAGKNSSTHVANVFVDTRIVQCAKTAYFLTDNGVQFTCKAIAELYSIPVVRHLTTTAHLLECGIILPNIRKTETITCNPYSTRTTRKCTSSPIRPVLVLYYNSIRLVPELGLSQVACLPTATLKLTRDGYILIYREKSLRCGPKPVRIWVGKRHSGGSIKTKPYPSNQRLYPASGFFGENCR